MLPGRNSRVEYVRTGAGTGRPLLYLHGSFGPEWSEPLVSTLAARHDVVAPCLPGYGGSDGLDRIETFYDLSVWLDEVLDALALDRIDIAGHDLGGTAAAEYAALFGRRVGNLTLVSPLGLWLHDNPMPDIFGLTPGALAQLLFADPGGEPARSFNHRHPDTERQQEAILRRRQALIAAAQLLWPIPDKGLSRRLYRIAAPTLLVSGDSDRITDQAYASAFVSLLPAATAISLPGGHMLPMETPQTLAAAIGDFNAAG